MSRHDYIHPALRAAVNAITPESRMPVGIDALRGAYHELKRDLAGACQEQERLRRENAQLVAALHAMNNAALLDGTADKPHMANARISAKAVLIAQRKVAS